MYGAAELLIDQVTDDWLTHCRNVIVLGSIDGRSAPTLDEFKQYLKTRLLLFIG